MRYDQSARTVVQPWTIYYHFLPSLTFVRDMLDSILGDWLTLSFVIEIYLAVTKGRPATSSMLRLPNHPRFSFLLILETPARREQIALVNASSLSMTLMEPVKG